MASTLFNEGNLPGSSINVMEQFDNLGYDKTQWGTTKSILIVGTAFDGPSGKETRIYNKEHANYIFGGSYDAKARRQSTLVAAIEDAYNAGCRTIYAIRVGGKEISKTFKLRENVDAYLKVSGLFPSNKNKSVYIEVDFNVDGEEVIRIYKPAARATILEKKQGLIENVDDVLVNTINVASTYGITKSDNLVDLIAKVNNYTGNNVVTLTLVNAAGDEISNTELGQSLSVGALFSGVYTIGRDKNVKSAETVLTAQPTAPYGGGIGTLYSTLTKNTDVNTAYPLTDVSSTTLTTADALDAFYGLDSIDYEEVKMSNFELYKRLGQGFVNTATLVKASGEDKYVVRPTPSSNVNAVQSIEDGIYSIAENLKTDMRVICVNADDKIEKKMPRKEEFISYITTQMTILSKEDGAPLITATSKEEVAKKYKFSFLPLEEALEVPVIPAKTSVSKEPSPTGISLVEVDGMIMVYKENVLLGSVRDLLSNKDEKIITKVERKTGVPEGDYLDITFQIDKDILSYTTLDELVEEYLSKTEIADKLNFTIVASSSDRLLYVSEVAKDQGAYIGEVVSCKNMSDGLGAYIPYTTTDNFLRQLSQHCLRSSIVSGQTLGFLGVAPIMNTSITSVCQKANQLLALNFDLYVKNKKGITSLDKQGLPFDSGRVVNVIADQHVLTTQDNYTYISNSAASYAGFVSTLNDEQSSTNQPFTSYTPQYTFSSYYVKKLTDKGFVTTSYRDEEYVITDGVTMANPLSQFSRLSTFTTISLVDRAIRTAANPYVGKRNNLKNRTSLKTAICSELDKLVGSVIESYEFSLKSSASDLFGNITADYSVACYGEIRTITNNVTATGSL